MTDQSDLWLVVMGAIGATYIWRFAGAALSHKIRTESSIFQWFTCVSYAMLAGLVSRMILIPVGPLTEVTLWIRLLCIALGLGVFLLAGRRVLPAVGIALLLFILLTALN